jgi:hypothetical protein
MKVFEMDDCTWYAGESAEDATRAFVSDCGVDEKLHEGYPRELTAEEMEQTIYVEDPYDKPDAKMPFREALVQMVERGAQFPCFFASTEW